MAFLLGHSKCGQVYSQDQLLQRPSSLGGLRLSPGPEHLDRVFHELTATWRRPGFQLLALSLETTDPEAPGWEMGSQVTKMKKLLKGTGNICICLRVIELFEG